MKEKDKKYVESINELIPEAIRNAEDIIMAERKGKGLLMPKNKYNRDLIARSHCDYDRIYHREMNRLAREAGLRNIWNTPWKDHGEPEIKTMRNTPEPFRYRNGKITTVKAVMQKYKLNYYTIASRRRRHPDACVEDIISEQPPRKNTVLVKTNDGKEISLREAAVEREIPYTSLYGRYKKFPGKSLEFLLSGQAGKNDYLNAEAV